MTDALALAADCATMPPGPERASAGAALCAAIRDGTGYRLPSGDTCRTWREAYRAWTAAARGHDAPRVGRPRGPSPRPRGGPAGRPSVRERTLAEVLVLLEEVAAGYAYDGDASAREAAAGVRYAAERVRALDEPSGNPG